MPKQEDWLLKLMDAELVKRRDKDQGNYSQLGEFSGQSAEEYLAALPLEGVTYFEFAVGLGTFLTEMKQWRPGWHFIGADLFRQSAHYPFDFILCVLSNRMSFQPKYETYVFT